MLIIKANSDKGKSSLFIIIKFNIAQIYYNI